MPTDPRSRAIVDAVVDRSAAPTQVRAQLDRLLERQPEVGDLLLLDDRFARATVAVLAASRSLGRLLVGRPDAVEVLAALDRRPVRTDTTVEELAAWKQRELLRITARDLLGLDHLERTTELLAGLAADVLEAACLLAEATDPDRAELALAVIGMGKLGGNELNYASDIDLVFVGDGAPGQLEKRARTITGIARRSYVVDTNLRPQGRDGPLVRSLDSYEAYWDRWAEPWEFQALLKARPVAGAAKLGATFAETARRWLWSRPFSADDLRALRRMKSRAEAEIARRGIADREIKRGRGGIRDIEFTVQLLQLVHGHLDPGLRGPTTLLVLREMASAGYVDPRDADALAAAYRFLRTVEHRLQLEDERQVHTVPDDPVHLDRLARVLGYRDDARAGAAEQLTGQLVRHQLAVRTIHEQIWFRPLLEAFADTGGALSPEAAVARLTAFGFTDATRTQVAVRELTRGLNRTSRLMQQLLPLVLDWLSAAPNPDLGLLMLRNLLSGSQRTSQLVEAFRDSAEVARRLCTLAGTSRLVADILVHHPDLVGRLQSDEVRRGPSRDELLGSARQATSWRTGIREQQLGLRRWHDRQLVGVAARDILDGAPVEAVGAELAALADVAIETALRALDPQIDFCVLALGRLGGAELSYASDLDVVFVYDGGRSGAEEAQRLASGLLRLIGGATPAERIHPIDAGLRPEGKQGPLARSLDGFVQYWERYALVWERQAMLRARPVAGDLSLGNRLLDALDDHIWARGLTDDDLLEIRRMKARIERERIPPGEDPQFHLKLGRGSLSDVEFTTQLLQLRHGVRSAGTMAALALLREEGAIADDDAETLETSYRFCERTRNRSYLINTNGGSSLPTSPHELLWLARSLERTPTDLREQYRRVTRRARRVVERVFYGQE